MKVFVSQRIARIIYIKKFCYVGRGEVVLDFVHKYCYILPRALRFCNVGSPDILVVSGKRHT